MLGDFAGDTEGWRLNQGYNPSFSVASLPVFLVLSWQDLLSDSGNAQHAGVGNPPVCLVPVIYLNYLHR